MSRRPALRIALGSFILAAAAACGSARPAPPAAAAPPPSCKQQYSAWQHGPARALGKSLVAAVNKVQAAGTAEDFPALSAALKSAGAGASALGAYPMPACADPHGYWGAMLARIKAAGDNAGTSSGLSGLILAEVPLKDVPGIEAELTAELKRTT